MTKIDMLMNGMPDDVERQRLPSWLKRPMPKGEIFAKTTQIVKEQGLSTVCESAMCPNLGECWSKGTATFMIMGERCTRACTFCAIDTRKPLRLENDEPMRVATAIQQMKLRHVVITSVARDDLKDDGADHFSKVIIAAKKMNPEVTVEVLTPDFKAKTECLDLIYDAKPHIFNHNVETIKRLTPEVRHIATYERTLMVLNYMASLKDAPITKSGFMVGLGETKEEIFELITELNNHQVKMLTIGQYLRPSKKHRPVSRYVHPDEFDEYRTFSNTLNFKHVASGPFVRSSYHADLSHDAMQSMYTDK
jgi:lipoic acid synthetase